MARRVAVLVCVALGGCSPYPYAQAVGKFADGVNSVSGAVRTSQTEARHAWLDAQRYSRRQRLATVTLSPRCQPVGDEPVDCTLIESDSRARERAGAEAADRALVAVTRASEAARTVVPARPGEGDFCRWETPGGAPPPAEPRRISVDLILSTLDDYVRGLTAVTNAKDREEFNAALADLRKSATALGTAAGATMGPAGAVLGPAAGAIVGFGGLVIGTSLDQRRYEVLRAAVLGSCLPVRTIADALGGILDADVEARRAYLQRSALQLTRSLRPNVSRQLYEERYREAEAATEALNAMGNATPSRAAEGMRAAHDALARAIANNEGQTVALLRTVGDFADAAREVRAALQPAPGGNR